MIPDAPLNLFPQIGICFSLSLSLSARFSFVFKLKRNVGPFFVGQLVDLSVKREKIKKMDSPVGHRPCWYTDTGEEEERERESTTAPDGRWRSTTRARDTWPPVLYTEGFSRSLLLPVVLSALFFSFLCYLCVYESPVLARDILCAAPGPIVPASGVPPRVSPPFSSFYPLLLFVFSYFVLFSPWSLALWPRRCLPLSSGSVQLNSAAQKKRRRIARSVTEKGHRLEHLIDI